MLILAVIHQFIPLVGYPRWDFMESNLPWIFVKYLYLVCCNSQSTWLLQIVHTK